MKNSCPLAMVNIIYPLITPLKKKALNRHNNRAITQRMQNYLSL